LFRGAKSAGDVSLGKTDGFSGHDAALHSCGRAKAPLEGELIIYRISG
jgi:hypothetical protein